MQTQQVERKVKRTPVLYKDYGDFSIHYGNRDNRDRLVSINISSHPWIEEVRKEIHEPRADSFNTYQYWLFRRALFGSEVYSSEEWNWLHPWKRERILGLQKKAEDVLNRWRQELVIGISDKIIDILIQGTRGSNWNPECGEARDNIKKSLECAPDDEFTCTFTLTDLKITKRMVAEKLVQTRVLPKRFFEMDVEDDPRYVLLSSREEVKLD